MSPTRVVAAAARAFTYCWKKVSMNLVQAHAAVVHAIVDEAVSSAVVLQRVDAVQATVTAVDASGKATVTWGGSTHGARRLASYTPNVNDEVLLLLAGSSPVILGQIV